MGVTFDRRKKVVDERVQGTFGDALRNPAFKLSQSSVRVVVVGAGDLLFGRIVCLGEPVSRGN
jgi:hypothetical protein